MKTCPVCNKKFIARAIISPAQNIYCSPQCAWSDVSDDRTIDSVIAEVKLLDAALKKAGLKDLDNRCKHCNREIVTPNEALMGLPNGERYVKCWRQTASTPHSTLVIDCEAEAIVQGITEAMYS